MTKQTKNRIILASIILVLLALAPFAFVARARAQMSKKPRLHVFFDMDNQPKFQAQQMNPLFRDGRQMRLPVEHTMAVEDYVDDVAATGRMSGQWVTAIPVPVDAALMARGQQQYNVYCAPCHGLSGAGDGMIARRADELMQVEASKWVPPTSYHSGTVLERPVGHIYNTITNGIRTMPPYRSQIAPHDRWAIVAYVKALQKSQAASIEEVPAAMRETLQ